MSNHIQTSTESKHVQTYPNINSVQTHVQTYPNMSKHIQTSTASKHVQTYPNINSVQTCPNTSKHQQCPNMSKHIQTSTVSKHIQTSTFPIQIASTKVWRKLRELLAGPALPVASCRAFSSAGDAGPDLGRTYRVKDSAGSSGCEIP